MEVFREFPKTIEYWLKLTAERRRAKGDCNEGKIIERRSLRTL